MADDPYEGRYAQEGARFTKALHELGINKSEAARRLGMSSGYISNLSRGNRAFTPQTLLAIETQLGIARAWVRDGEGPMMVRQSAFGSTHPTPASPAPPAPAGMFLQEPGMDDEPMSELVRQLGVLVRKMERCVGVKRAPDEMYELVDQIYAHARPGR
jgi:transcriptional regulator with XRE-family HTH domain